MTLTGFSSLQRFMGQPLQNQLALSEDSNARVNLCSTSVAIEKSNLALFLKQRIISHAFGGAQWIKTRRETNQKHQFWVVD